jgi:DNA-binding response OmpR family regulator
MATILVVEDQDEIATLIRFKLKNSGHDVLLAENGEVGLASARSGSPDLIILDVTMPVMDGLTALRALKSDEKLKSIPVIMLTAQSSEPAVVEAFKLGAVDYITKPFRGREFLERVEAALSAR